MPPSRKKLLLVVGTVLLLVALACTCTDAGLTSPAGGGQGGTGTEIFATEEPLVTADSFLQAATPTNSFDIVVTDFHLYRDDGLGNPGEEVDSFSPSDQSMHFELNTEGLPDGEITRWVFIAVETSDGNDIEIASVETGETVEADQLTANLTLPEDWPTGTYKAEVYVGDELIYTIEYEVEE